MRQSENGAFKFGQTYANNLRHKSPRPGDQWHMDEVFLKINGRLHYLGRAVDQDGDVLDILVQSRRDKEAAKKFFRKLEHSNFKRAWRDRSSLGGIPRFHTQNKPTIYSGYLATDIDDFLVLPRSLHKGIQGEVDASRPTDSVASLAPRLHLRGDALRKCN